MSDRDVYCRAIEAYLCRKNDGHLIRIVGPAFERVSRWALDGVPLKVACAGIDRYFERYYRRGPRRRPVRVEFCEADVLDAFDDWRRAVGITLPRAGPAAADPDADPVEQAPGRRRISLARHVEQVSQRLAELARSAPPGLLAAEQWDEAARDVAAVAGAAGRLRGEAREAVLAQLRALDTMLMSAILASVGGDIREAADAEAREALAPFRDRMDPGAYQRAHAAAVTRYIRDRFALPTIEFER